MEEYKVYIGCKVILAIEKTKENIDGYEVKYPDGYISWSPKEVFEEAYREISNKERKLING